MSIIPMKEKKFDMVGFGEVMLRLSPGNKEKISRSESFEKQAGGSELNVASGAAFLGVRSAIITRLPDNKVGRFAKYKIRYGNVSDDYLIYDTSKNARLGIYYYEAGAYPRKSSVVYDRANSSICTMSADEINPKVFDNTRLFHVSGITMALNENLKDIVIDTVKKFKVAGAAVSFDVNYRAKLWSEEEAKAAILQVLPYVDILFVSEETSRRMMQKTGTLEDIMKSYSDEYGCKVVATTKREVVSPTRHNFGSKLYYNGNFYEEPAYENIEVIDRIGSGDAYVAGALYALLTTDDPMEAVRYGNAMSAVKCTTNGDMPAASLEEIQSVIKSHTAEGPQEEMSR